MAAMLLSKGRVAPTEPWKILEVAPDQSPDVIAIRLQKELKRIHEPGIEAIVPFRRNADGETEWIVEHVYVRGANGSLRAIANTPGIDFIRKELADWDWIKRLLAEESSGANPGIAVGQFVRILSGPCSRMCGTVTRIWEPQYTVTVEMRTKNVKVHTFEKNLQVINCPPEHRVFFYRAELFS